MKLTKKLLLASSALLLSATAIVGVNKKDNSLKVEAEEEEVSLPFSVTRSIYNYAEILGDSLEDVDKALISWLNATDNLSGISFFTNPPVEFNEDVFRKTKDYFYVLAYLQRYMSNTASTSKSPSDATLMILDHAMGIRDYLFGLLNDVESKNIESAFDNCKSLYEYIVDTVTCLEADYYCINFQPFESFVKNAKTYFEKEIEKTTTLGFDQGLNNYSYFKSVLNGYGQFTFKNPDEMNKYSTEILDYVLFNDNSLDTFLTRDFIDFDLDEYQNAMIQAGATTPEKIEEESVPYVKKMDYQLFSYLIDYNYVVTTLDVNSTITLVNNFGPLLYKIVADYTDARINNDISNFMIMAFEMLDDFENLLELAELNTNKKDLGYEKYIANMRLGSLVQNASKDKFAKYLVNVEAINNVALTGKTYEQGVEEINSLVEAAYKDINVDLFSNSEQAPLKDVIGLRELASREQAYSFELSKMKNTSHIDLFLDKILEDYALNSYFVDFVWLDMTLTDKNTKQVVPNLEDPVQVSFDIEDLFVATDIKVYRYDEATSKVISLANQSTASGTDYFSVDNENMTVHTKDFGTYLVTHFNSVIKDEVEGLRSDITSLQSQVNALNNDVSVKAATITELQNKVTELEGKITTLESEVSSKQGLVNSLQTELDSVKTALNAKLEYISDLESTNNSKNTLNIIFIILTCVFAASTVGITTFYLLKKKRD